MKEAQLMNALHQALMWLEHPEVNALPTCGSPKALASHIRLLLEGNCPRCYGEMKKGLATQQTMHGFSDFPGREVVTLSPGGGGDVVECMKCEKCGHSVTLGSQQLQSRAE